MKTFLIIFTLSIHIMHSSATYSQVYKWIDENGKVHFSDKPISHKSKKIEIKDGPSKKQIDQAKARARSIIQHQKKVQDISNEEAEDRKDIADKLERKEAKRKKLCQQAEREIRILGRGGVTYTEDKTGKRHYLSDAEKNESIAALQSEMSKHCQ